MPDWKELKEKASKLGKETAAYIWDTPAALEAARQRRRLREQPPEPEGMPDLNEMLLFGGQWIEKKNFGPHFLFVGATRSGKTRMLRMLIRSAILRQSEEGPIPNALKSKGVFYDGKHEILKLLPALGIPEEQTINTNPFIVGAHRWDMSADITSLQDAQAATAIWFPETNDSGDNSFFPTASRQIVTAIIYCFILMGRKNWTLFDVARLALNTKKVEALFDKFKTEYVIYTANQNLLKMQAEVTRSGITANIYTYIARLWPVACLWEWQKQQGQKTWREWQREDAARRGVTLPADDEDNPNNPVLWPDLPIDRTFSLEDFRDSPEPRVLVINKHTHSPVIQDLNKILLRSTADAIGKFEVEENNPHAMPNEPACWLFLDEMHLAGHLDFLAEMLSTSAGKGIPASIVTQDTASLLWKYNEQEAKLMLNQIDNIAVYRLAELDTATDMSKRFGQIRRRHVTESWSENYGHDYSHGVSTTEQAPTDEFHVLPQELMNLRMADKDWGIEGIFAIPGVSHRRMYMRPRDVDHFSASGRHKKQFERPPSHQISPDYTPPEDMELWLNDFEPWLADPDAIEFPSDTNNTPWKKYKSADADAENNGAPKPKPKAKTTPPNDDPDDDRPLSLDDLP